ncbi:MAG: hypothetical protein WBM90_10250 [Acidimicrobiia bacterium]
MDQLRPSSRWRPIIVAWLLVVGVDLFFNAGVFTRLFDQSREPGLLSDAVLFRRIPVTYLALAVGVAALAWLFDRLDVKGSPRGTIYGGLAGVAVVLLGVINLWAAIEMTGLFVASAALVQIVELGAAGSFFGSYRVTATPKRRVRITMAISLVLGILGVVIQNLLDR